MNIGTWTLTDSRGRILSGPDQQALNLGATGLNEVLQNVRVIITTRIGTVMLDRKFGLDYSFLDAPQNKAQLMMIQQMCQGLTNFEPRVTFSHIQFGIDPVTYAMNVTLAINIKTSEILLPSS
jgi:phage baseplate assembly protein W